MKSNSPAFQPLLEHCLATPLFDTHDHTLAANLKYTDPITMLIDWYLCTDLASASSEQDLITMQDTTIPWEERWPVFESAWKRTRFTGYAQCLRRSLQHFYGFAEPSLDALRGIQDRLIDLSDPVLYEHILDEAGIVVRLQDINLDSRKILTTGRLDLPPRSRWVISLPWCHRIQTYEDVAAKGRILNRNVTSLDEYLDVCRTLFEAYKRAGAVAFKDQSAYTRPLDYRNPTRAEAERVFNWILEDQRRSLAYPDGDGRILSDYLFHEFMRMARDMDLPVQIHTGHMGVLRNDIVKTNAIGLTSLIELHRDVRFDLFHANWPYSGEILYLAKNYPNVRIDFCWANIVDPIYCQALFQQALSSVPHGKIHAYGSDLNGNVDRAWAHAQMARENVSIALANLVDMDYLSLADAKDVASAWLYGNAREWFGIGE
jgi:hypothetical protein